MSGRLLVTASGRYNPDFDLATREVWPVSFADDLEFSLAEEVNLAGLLMQAGDTVELKVDGRALETGNVFIETQQKPKGGDWKPSGINTTKATFWAFKLPNGVTILAPTARVLDLTEGQFEVEQRRDDSNPAKGHPLKIKKLIGIP
jgi:hypothetical protein